MRLFLSSYQLGDHQDLLTTMVQGRKRGWVVSNALDGYDEERHNRASSLQIAALKEIGLDAQDLDLREHDPSSIRAKVGAPDFLWIRGGNVFTLRMALARSGMDAVIKEGLRRDSFVYAGFSAGPCVLAPSLAGLELCDPVQHCISAYGNVRFDGLGVLDRPIVPHLNSPRHPETQLLGEVARNYRNKGQPYWALRDGQALITADRGLEIR